MPALEFLVTLRAQPGREEEVAAFLRDAKAIVDAEPGTLIWFAFRSGPSSFGIFDAFTTEEDRQIHLGGQVRQGLDAHPELFAVAPVITPVDILTAKMPTSGSAESG